MKKRILLIFCCVFIFVAFCLSGKAQVGRKTIGNYSSVLQNKEIKGKSVATKIYYQANGNVLTIEDNMAEIGYADTRADTLPFFKSQVYKFKYSGVTPGNLKEIFENNKFNLLRMEGTLTINGITKNYIALYAPILLEKSSDEIRMNFELKFTLADFGLSADNFLFSDLVELRIENGYVNLSE